MECFSDLDIGEEQGTPLPELFQRAQEAHSQLEDGELSQDDIRAMMTDLHKCQNLVERLSLFSSNEDADDVATGDLKYLLIPFYLGEAFLNLHNMDRKIALTAAKSEFSKFLDVCENLDLLAELTVRSIHREQPPDPNTKRTEKIMRFKRAKEIKTKLEGFEAKRKKDGVSANESEQEASDYTEEEREVWCLQIESAGSKCEEHIDSMATEFQLLAMRPPPGQEAPAVPPEVLAQREEIAAALRDAAANLTGRAGERQAVREGVFKPTHILPTMTVEQFGEQEHREMVEQQQAAARAQQAAREREGGDYWTKKRGDEEEDEDELKKSRAWDDWKDDHQRGAGNSKLRPCA